MPRIGHCRLEDGLSTGPHALDSAAEEAAEELGGSGARGTAALFAPGQSSSFVLDVPRGALGGQLPSELEVLLHTGGGPATAWHLRSACLTRLSDGARAWFWCGGWLGGGAAAQRRLPALSHDPEATAATYMVSAVARFAGCPPRVPAALLVCADAGK